MDINTISELINEFVRAEKEILNQHDIKHPTTIGTMYEGLTKSILEKSVFGGLNLRIILNSFIKGCNTEFDVMLVEGEGEKIPYSDRYRYPPEQIIAIISVRKNLYTKDLIESFNNLQFIIEYFKEKKPEKYAGRLIRDGFRAICRKDIANSDDLLIYEDFILHTLRVEALLPVRIIWGYNGFTNELNFRKSFFEYLESNLTTDLKKVIPGFGPHNFPNLIICGKYTMLKQNGMPFGCPLTDENWWPFFTTTSYRPTKFFLETIWTRLSYKYKLPPEIFGEDLIMEPVNRFLDCRIKNWEGNYGWEYYYNRVTNENLQQNIEEVEWQPVELDLIQFNIINELCTKGEIDLISDKNLEPYLVKDGTYSSLTEFVERLKDTGLVFVEKRKLKLLTNKCQCVILPNGKFIAGENNSGRLTNWVMKEIDRIKKEKQNSDKKA
jgi:hypothetical protein